ncbi:MAG TPA: GNAT family N-acetyltransferase [Candidatus Limnocylindria bacterium]|nr:GNAT family N-acetyltransferase [Candidatus Limnocylindria bacterium]
MTDLLVRLYDLPPRRTVEGVHLRRGLPPEKHAVLAWVRAEFGEHWASECDVAFAHQPVGCHVAVRGERLVGMACWDATALGFFGPMATAERERGKGIGAALLLECLHAMSAHGYAYAVIGGVGPREFYDKVVQTLEIPGSTPGIYRGMLR